jgi:hypothetical protein
VDAGVDTMLEEGSILEEDSVMLDDERGTFIDDADAIAPKELSVEETDLVDRTEDERSEELDAPSVAEPSDDCMEGLIVDAAAEPAEPEREIPELVTADPDVVLAAPKVNEAMLAERESLVLSGVGVGPEDGWTARREVAMAKSTSI